MNNQYWRYLSTSVRQKRMRAKVEKGSLRVRYLYVWGLGNGCVSNPVESGYTPPDSQPQGRLYAEPVRNCAKKAKLPLTPDSRAASLSTTSHGKSLDGGSLGAPGIPCSRCWPGWHWVAGGQQTMRPWMLELDLHSALPPWRLRRRALAILYQGPELVTQDNGRRDGLTHSPNLALNAGSLVLLLIQHSSRCSLTEACRREGCGELWSIQ